MVQAVPKDVLEKNILPLIPTGRLGEPEEIARCVVFLASDDAGFITGSTLSANGGQLMILILTQRGRSYGHTRVDRGRASVTLPISWALQARARAFAERGRAAACGRGRRAARSTPDIVKALTDARFVGMTIPED